MKHLAPHLFLCVLLGASPALADARAENVERWHRVVGLLEYVQGDYANALSSGDAAELDEQSGFLDEVVKQLEGAGPSGAGYVERAKAVQAQVNAHAAAEDVAKGCGALAQSIVTDQALARTPKQVPSLEAGAQRYLATCASCHGATGNADTEVAKALDPPPAKFTDDARMATLTPYKVFNTLSFGIPGTGMPGFAATLDEPTRWAIAFHVFTLRQAPCSGPAPQASLFELATSTDAQLGAKYGAGSVACLRRSLPSGETDTLPLALAGLDDALEKYGHGDFEGARQAVVDAYLQGLEPVEPLLRSRDPALVSELEAAFTRTRIAAQKNQYFEAEVMQTRVLVARAQGSSHASSFWSVFFTAILILLREGFEAVVVVGALLAVLQKLGATNQARVVHLGWISSLVVGAVVFVFGHAFIAGANREWMESLVSLVAVGFLLYAALWLNARATMSRFMGELRGKMTTAIGAGSSAGLFFISFSSVGRESLETALFLQGLAIDSQEGVVWGASAGLVALLGMVALVRTVGFKLPMKTLFSASTVLLVVTAVALLGKGLHGLQELGVLPLVPLRFFTIELLGIYPDALSLLPQVALSLAPFAWKWVGQRRALTPTPAPDPTPK
ncbi:MAG: FTR1 family protein [Myxococcaceae bacterium]